MNMRDDLITQIYTVLSMGVDIADGVGYGHNILNIDHNIVDTDIVANDTIMLTVEDYDGNVLNYLLKLELYEG